MYYTAAVMETTREAIRRSSGDAALELEPGDSNSNGSSRLRSDSHWDYELNSRSPIKLTWRQIASVTLHWRCLTLTVLLGVCFSLITWCKIPDRIDGELREPCRNGLIWIPTAITLVFYLLYIIECFHCKIHRDIINIVSSNSAELILQRWIKAKPVIKWRAVCYHYGRSFRQRYSPGPNGSQTIPQLQYTRVNTHSTVGKYQPYDCGCVDKSTPLINIAHFNIIKIDVEKTFSFGCPCSEAAYLTQRKAFYESQVTIDDNKYINEVFYLAGSQVPDSICIINPRRGLPWYFTKPAYWFFSFLCLSWPIRMVLEKKTAYAALSIHKEFGGNCNGILASSGHSVSSYDSKATENMYGIIPSYSEALLMSSYTLNGSRLPSTLPAAVSSKSVMVHADTYETIGGADEEPLLVVSPQNKLYTSKTADNLQSSTHHVLNLRKSKTGIPRSISLHSPILEGSESQDSASDTSTHIEPPLTTRQLSPQANSSSTPRPSYSCHCLANSVQQSIIKQQRSKTADEKIYLLI